MALAITGCLHATTVAPPALSPAPAFSLPSHDGRTVSLAELRRRGPVVVVFYRGFW